MPIEAGAAYVFDLGYYDYTWWKKLDEAQCRGRHPLQGEHTASVDRGTPSRPRVGEPEG
jgi:hypothetical protein